jgi:phosphoglycolate phosphatase-like HAD superfamily hydrolase
MYRQHYILFLRLSTLALLLRSRAAAFVVPSTATSWSRRATASLDPAHDSILSPGSRTIRATSTSGHAANDALILKMASHDELYLFDFDGVVCDSCDECTVSALRTIQKLKKAHIDSDDGKGDTQQQFDYPPQWLFNKMREVRPAIEIGWQIPVLLDVILEQSQNDDACTKSIMSVDTIMSNYEQLVDDWLSTHDKTEQEMVDAFGDVRDAWIKDDMASWLEINKFYPGVPQALNTCKGKAVLVTTKQQRFATALCRHAGVTEDALPDEDIYGLGMYTKKSDVIVDRLETGGGYAPSKTFFFEDRWPTLAKCLADERLNGVKFYLCSWGYVTQHELDLAHAEPRVTVITLDDFASIVASS